MKLFKSTRIDYKKELESAAKTMILVHDPETLIRLVVRMIIQKVNVRHAGILLHDKMRDTYVLNVSRGSSGIKIPAGFARMDSDNALVTLFKDKSYKELLADGALTYNEAKRIIKHNSHGQKLNLLKKALYQMEIFQAVACIPSYYGKELLAILLLGAKKNGSGFARSEINFFTALASDVAMAVRNAQLIGDLESELNKKYRLLIHTIVALAAAIDAKDHYTHGHTERVTNVSLEIANKISQNSDKACNEKFIESLRIASLLHDIGKIGIPESILNKQGPLTAEETKIMREHTVVGSTILEPITELEDAILGVKYHHERFDGSGYPEGLKGNETPFLAAIIAVADAFDAMISDRPYRKALSREKAAYEITSASGRQFDPRVVNAFFELYQEGKI